MQLNTKKNTCKKMVYGLMLCAVKLTPKSLDHCFKFVEVFTIFR